MTGRASDARGAAMRRARPCRVRDRRPAPRPRPSPRDARAGRLHPRRSAAATWADAGLAARRPAARRGVADRVGQVLRGARPRARVRRSPATPTAWRRGRTWSARSATRCRSGTTPPTCRPGGIQNWLYAWQRFAAAPAWRGPATRTRRAARASGCWPTATHLRDAPHRGAQPPHARAVRAAGRSRWPSDAGTTAAAGAWPRSRRTPPPTSRRTASTASARSDYHMIVLRSLRRRDRQRRGSAGDPRPAGARRADPRACATSRCTCSDPTARPRRSPTATRATTAPLLRRAGRAARPARPALGGQRRRRGVAAGRRGRRASRSAATSSSAAAGATAAVPTPTSGGASSTAARSATAATATTTSSPSS